jgi:4-carboxymuconolactone decarboxylase
MEMSRLPALTPDDLDHEQKRLRENLMSGLRAKAPRKFPLENPDGSLNGPFNVLLYNAAIGEQVQQLGNLLRFESKLPGQLREVAILTVAQHWRSNYEWFAHVVFAEREGVDAAAIAAIKQGKEPEDNADWATVHRLVSEFLNTARVSDDTYKAAIEKFGEPAMVELVTLAGYYCMISAILNVFEIPVPDGETPPFGDAVLQKP